VVRAFIGSHYGSRLIPSFDCIPGSRRVACGAPASQSRHPLSRLSHIGGAAHLYAWSDLGYAFMRC
jgi:hypothetical protein